MYNRIQQQFLIEMNQGTTQITKIAIFRNRKIRKTVHKNEWWFVVVDVVAVLTDSIQPDGYIKDMRRRDPELSKGWGQIATPLSIKTSGGVQKLNCANYEKYKNDYFMGKISTEKLKNLHVMN